jgi:hypothetical protein
VNRIRLPDRELTLCSGPFYLWTPRMLSRLVAWIGNRILDYLGQPIADYEPFFAPPIETLATELPLQVNRS